MNPVRWLPEVITALLAVRETFITQVNEKVRTEGETMATMTVTVVNIMRRVRLMLTICDDLIHRGLSPTSVRRQAFTCQPWRTA